MVWPEITFAKVEIVELVQNFSRNRTLIYQEIAAISSPDIPGLIRIYQRKRKSKKSSPKKRK